MGLIANAERPNVVFLLSDEHAALVNQNGKLEAYYFPPQVNNYGADFPYTFFGFEPGTKKEQVLECLKTAWGITIT